MKDVYITYYKRTPFSRAKPDNPSGDVYNRVSMDVLFSNLIRDSLNTGITPEEIGDVITGCAIQAGENWTYGGRHQVLLSELPVSVPSMSIDRACSSSLNAITIGTMEIQTGNSDIVLAGGMEHMTHEGNTKTVDADQTPRPNTTLEQMRQLKPAFKENGYNIH